MGDTFPNHNNNSYYRNPTFYYIGTLDPLGVEDDKRPAKTRDFSRPPAWSVVGVRMEGFSCLQNGRWGRTLQTPVPQKRLAFNYFCSAPFSGSLLSSRVMGLG